MKIIDGRYIFAGNKNLYARISGSGTPPIIIETGMGSLAIEWIDIQIELSKHTTVISYDRAGYGESPTGDKPRSSNQIANELFNMLVNSGIQGPYIFIGHSMGGIYVQQFAIMFPQLVSGILFADSITIDDDNFNNIDAPFYQENASIQARIKNIEKMLELEDEDFKDYVKKMLEGLYTDVNSLDSNPLAIYQSDKKLYRALVDEYYERGNSFNIIKQAWGFPNVPVSVLCRDYNTMINISKEIGIPEEEARLLEEMWLVNSEKLLKVSNQSKFVIVQGSSHAMHLSRPDIIIDEAVKLLNQVRK